MSKWKESARSTVAIRGGIIVACFRYLFAYCYIGMAEGNMGYAEKELVARETVAYKTGCHWIVMFWPLLGGLVLGFLGFALFAAGWMATRNGGRYEGAMVWRGLALFGAACLVGGGVIRWQATEVGVSNKRC